MHKKGFGFLFYAKQKAPMGVGGGTGIDDLGEKVTRDVYPEHVV